MIKFDDLSDKEINRIVFEYYLENYPDRPEAIQEYAKLNRLLAENPAARLLRVGNIVFLLCFTEDQVEFHSMGRESSAFAFIRDIYRMIDQVRTLPVRAISTYGSNPVFERLYDRVLVSAQRDQRTGPDGAVYNYYKLEF